MQKIAEEKNAELMLENSPCICKVKFRFLNKNGYLQSFISILPHFRLVRNFSANLV